MANKNDKIGIEGEFAELEDIQHAVIKFYQHEDLTNLYLLSNLGSAVTGEIQHVDCGYHTVGMVAVDEASNVSELLGEFVSNK